MIILQIFSLICGIRRDRKQRLGPCMTYIQCMYYVANSH